MKSILTLLLTVLAAHSTTLLTALLLAPLAALAAADSPRPNIVLIMADDQGWGDIGYNGHPELKTPNLDALAASGLRLDRFYAAHCNCSPTRGSVMTGRVDVHFEAHES